VADLRTFRALARNWEALGDADPLYGVLSDPSKQGRQWSQEDFFESGRAHVDMLLRMLSSARASVVPGACLDFGCGVGRLTLPLSEHFEWTIGVDVAEPMIDAARDHAPTGARCEFVLNRQPDLRCFADGTFDLVHSSLVLQHIPPGISLRYVGEFVRVCKPGGLVVFQLPAAARSAREQAASDVLLPEACRAALALVTDVPTLSSSESASVVVRVTNLSPTTWRHDIGGGRHICVGNHWLRADGGSAIADDGRAPLPRDVEPGVTIEIPLTVRAPDVPGEYQLELDLVQEHVCWFADRGSTTARANVRVASRGDARLVDTEPVAPPLPVVPALPVAPRQPVPPRSRTPASPRANGPGRVLRRLVRRLTRATPTFEMHVVPRADVERTLERAGAQVLCVVDDNAAGPAWLSYTYVCRRAPSGDGH
jgi:SAM-dependent methyltransferase